MTTTDGPRSGLVPILFGVIGAALLVAASASVGPHLAPPAGWAATRGVVVENVETAADSFQPVVEYHVDGRSYRVRSSVSQSPPRRIGAQSDVWYERSNPAVARSAGFLDRFLVGLILAAVGLPFVLVYLGTRWYHRRRGVVRRWQTPAASQREEGRRSQRLQRGMGVAFTVVAVCALAAGIALSFVVANPLSLFALWINVAIFGAIGGGLLWTARPRPEAPVPGAPVPGLGPAMGEDRSEPTGTVPEPLRESDRGTRPLYDRDGLDRVTDDGPPLVR